MRYAELHCLSNFTFLRGASHPQELIARADELGYTALALTDECSMAGVVRAHMAAKDRRLKLVIGSEFRLDCGLRFVALATNRRGYGRLCRLITRGRRAAPKGSYALTRTDLAALPPEDCFLLWLPGSVPQAEEGRWLADLAPGRVHLAVELLCSGEDRRRLRTLEQLGTELGIPLLASGDVHMHVRERRRLQDALTAIRLRVPLTATGWQLHANGERYLREPARLKRLYPPALLEASAVLAEACHFSLDELRYEYPHELVPAGQTPRSHLRRLVEQGAGWRWPDGVPAREQQAIEHELELIAEMGYEPYFLTVHDIVAWARNRGILCQGRGSAANSRVCYCLGITAVDPMRGPALLFERFISRERNEPPDIDVDFEHERREEVIQYVYAKYGRERAALAATVIMYRPRSALRDLGRAFGLEPTECARLTRLLQWWDGGDAMPQRLHEAGFDPKEPPLSRILPLARELTAFPGFPRHLSQHVGGFVISERLLEELVPVENASMPDRTVVQWDKDDLNDLGLLKVDLLALGMLSALRRAFDLVNGIRGTRWSLGALPAEDPGVYDMICRADTVGVFQIESRAQMAMLPRLKPRCYYDLVIEVAIVRPGPIQGDMVHPYLMRRESGAPLSYPDDSVEEVLKRTLGVPIFQEQVMQLAIVAAGFTPGEADALRRAMGAWKRSGGIEHFREKLIHGMRARGHDAEFAERVYNQMLGFGEYGFPECVVGETRVMDADSGRWITIDEIRSGRARVNSTFAFDANLCMHKRRVVGAWESGIKPVLRLTTALGHTLLATAEHPLMTPVGWQGLGSLKPGDFVAAARNLPVRSRRRWPKARVLVLADLLAEGNLCHPNTFYFYTTEKWHCDDFVRSVEQFANTRAVIERNKNCWSVRVRRINRSFPSEAVAWTQSLGIWGLGARSKHVPPEVFTLCDSDIALFLARLWEGDGGLSLVDHATYDTASRRLAEEVQYLLLRLGIVARLYSRIRMYRDRQVQHFSVCVTGNFLRRFCRLISRRCLDPGKRLKARQLAACGIGECLKSEELVHIARSEVYWDRIVSVEPEGEQMTYDLEIEGDHNFLANHLVVHNSHAASFALLVYDSAWLKCHEPAAFTCALLNSQPMGFYAPAQLVRDARAHGVEVRAIDVCASDWDATLESCEAAGWPALRLGLRLVKHLSRAGADRLLAARAERSFASVQDLARRAALDRGDLEALAAAGALASLSGNRHLAFWEVAGSERPLPLASADSALEQALEGRPLLPAPTAGEGVIADYASTGLTLGPHPVALLRERLRSRGVLSAGDLAALPHGRVVCVAGIVLMRQRPQTASGVTFVTLEDESGAVNVIVWATVGEAQRRALLESRLLEVHGELQRQHAVTHVIARRLIDRSALLGSLVARSRDFH